MGGGSLQRFSKRVEIDLASTTLRQRVITNQKGATHEPPLLGAITVSLEVELQCKLNQPWVSGGSDAAKVG